MKMPRYRYQDNDEELYKTDAYNGSDADIDDTERFTGDVDLTEMRYGVVDFKYAGTNATDDLVIILYRRRDRNWTGKENAVETTKIISQDGSEAVYCYPVLLSHGPGHYRYGMKSSGANTTFEIEVQARRSR